MTNWKRRSGSLALAVLLAAFFAGAALADDGIQLAQPKLQIPIPEVNLSKAAMVGDKLNAPYLLQYIRGVYTFLLSVVGVVAAISMIWGGFLYLTAGGDASRAGRGTKRISNAVVGLILAYGSYLVLYLVNPDLVQFKNFQLITVAPQVYDDFSDMTPEIGAPAAKGARGSGDTTYDAIFQKYAPCAGTDWRVLRAIAYKESSFDANHVNASGYTGLFQTKTATCSSVLGGYNFSSQCANLTNPDVNTAVGAMLLKKAVTTIQGRCPNASLQDQFIMVYMNHNMGPGVLRYATNSGCDAASLRRGAILYYQNVGTTTAKSYSNKYQQGCLSSGKSAAECTGGPKFDYAQQTAATMSSFGATALIVPSGTCPLQ